MHSTLYSDFYKYEDKHWWFVARRKIIQKFIKKCINVSGDFQILEIGAGTGGNLAMLKTFGNVDAMEMDKNAVQMANQRNICEVQVGSLPNDIPFHQQFDLVVMLDVLEHIEDDYAALDSIKVLLKEQSKLLITVPAYQSLWSNRDVVNQHFRRYNIKNLTELLLRCNFKVSYCSYYNTFLFLPFVLKVIFDNLKKEKRRESDLNIPSDLINYFLKKIFCTERFLIPHIKFPFGVSIIMEAEFEKSSKI